MVINLFFNLNRKYLRDNEREELSREAATLCVLTLRNKIKDLASASEEMRKFIMEVFNMYKRATKSSLREPKLSSVLTEIYSKLVANQVRFH